MTSAIQPGDSFDGFLGRVLELLPQAEVGEDNEGQLVIYTGLRVATQDSDPTVPAGDILVEMEEGQS